jgi:hypothetical protein
VPGRSCRSAYKPGQVAQSASSPCEVRHAEYLSSSDNRSQTARNKSGLASVGARTADLEQIDSTKAGRSTVAQSAARCLTRVSIATGVIPFILDVASERDPWEPLEQQMLDCAYGHDPGLYRVLADCRCG